MNNSNLFKGVYFGKCDKNGVPIHEGNKLKFKSYLYNGREFEGIVRYNAVSCSFRVDRDCEVGFSFTDIYDIETIRDKQFINVGRDEDGRLLGNCTICGDKGTDIENHKCN